MMPTADGARDAGRTNEGGAQVRERLTAAAAGLLFLSEMDAPFEYVELPDIADGEVTSQAVASAAGSSGAPVAMRSLDEFLAGHIDQADPADPVGQENVPRFRALKAALTETLSDVRVFRVGEVEVSYYVIGRTEGGCVAGLVTRALET